MKKYLRHSHIAVKRSLGELARTLNATIVPGEDDLGPYRYFDLAVNNGQTIRFASHKGDAMVHILAEDINAVGELASALFAVGISSRVKLSISTDQNGQFLRNAEEIRELLADSVEVKQADRVGPKQSVAINKSTENVSLG